MPKFPVDASGERVLKALQRLGFELIRESNHIALALSNPEAPELRSRCRTIG